MKILFVCTGNTCRSPMAEALLRHRRPDWSVKSAGIYAASDCPISEQAKLALEEKKIDAEHISQGISEEILEWADVVLTMTASHRSMLISQFPEAAQKIHVFKQYVRGQQEDVQDPFGGSIEQYRMTRDELEQLMEQLIEKLSN
ncbi:low molecular weight protein arginine phosphatase [Bacillus xiapuensis]|uniref:low molecular weight protein arginine phosphatase n=1 Tax=Bacillus xiapuensis TaxID=2014075 RepID=UPI000C2391BC|nr:low molecular weight protein arginine phosphatase [Bacillus xiapuensis]